MSGCDKLLVFPSPLSTNVKGIIMRSPSQLMLTPVKLLIHYRLFQRREDQTSSLQIILWWETRRLFFNIVVGIAGLITAFTFLFSAKIAERLVHEPFVWPDPPLFAIIGVVLYAIVANVCYTGGWIAELIAREVWEDKAGNFAEISFTLGIIFSFLLTLLPGALAVFAVVARFVFIQVMK
jgi:hypothetical protein